MPDISSETNHTARPVNILQTLNYLIHPWDLKFREKKTEEAYQYELFIETASFGRFTWIIASVTWIFLGAFIFFSTRNLPDLSQQKLFITYISSGLILSIWFALTKMESYRKWHQYIQIFAQNSLAVFTLVFIYLLPSRYHLPAFTFFIVAILVHYSTVKVTFYLVLISAFLMTSLFSLFAWITSSYPTAEGGILFFAFYMLLANITGIALYRYHSKQHRRQFLTSQMLDAEKHNSDQLLLSIFPSKIAGELKIHAKIEPLRLDNATVIFCDLSGFTSWSANKNPKLVIEMLDELFSTFDRLAAELGVDKVKTIGDAYMACSNLTTRSDYAARSAVVFGLETIKTVDSMRDSFGGANIGLRVGIATGSVVAGVIGTSKPSYDIWGETVNLASRLESNGTVGEVLVCAKTFELLSLNESGVWKKASIELKGLGMKSAFAIQSLDGNK